MATTPFDYPFIIDKNTPAIADEVQSNFDDLLAWIKANYLQIGGSPSMVGPLTLPGPPASPNQAATKTYVDGQTPIGTMYEYAGTVLPAKYRWCDGAVYSQTDPLNQALFAVIQTAYNKSEDNVPAGSFQVPDKRGKVGVGFQAGNATFGTLGARGGQADAELFQHLHSVPQHGHTLAQTPSGAVDHLHPVGSLAINGGGHEHTLVDVWHWLVGAAELAFSPGSGQLANRDQSLSTQGGGAHSHGITGSVGNADRSLAHTHTITVDDKLAFNTVNAGAGTTLVNKNLQPYLVCQYIIYAGA